MAAGFPVKADYVTGDVLSAANMNDLAGTLNYLDPTAKGDLFPASSGTALTRLAVGANDTVLTADSSTATGLKWAASAGGGKIAQVLQTFKSDTFTSTSTSYVDITGLSVTITPAASTSKILVMMTVQGAGDLGASTMGLQLMRGATAIAIGDLAGSRRQGTTNAYSASNNAESMGMNYLDSPATTSATTYKIQGVTYGAGTFFINRTENDNNNSDYGRFASSIIVMEVLA